MSELQTRFIDDTYVEYYNTGKHDLAQIYLKSEADQVIADLEESHKKEVEQLLMEIAELQKQVHDYAQGLYVMQARAEKEARHDKYKRCLAMAKWCDTKADWYYGIGRSFRDRVEFYIKWCNRWLKIAEKVKEVTNAVDKSNA